MVALSMAAPPFSYIIQNILDHLVAKITQLASHLVIRWAVAELPLHLPLVSKYGVVSLPAFINPIPGLRIHRLRGGVYYLLSVRNITMVCKRNPGVTAFRY
jgi:hypothetical protein